MEGTNCELSDGNDGSTSQSTARFNVTSNPAASTSVVGPATTCEMIDQATNTTSDAGHHTLLDAKDASNGMQGEDQKIQDSGGTVGEEARYRRSHSRSGQVKQQSKQGLGRHESNQNTDTNT